MHIFCKLTGYKVHKLCLIWEYNGLLANKQKQNGLSYGGRISTYDIYRLKPKGKLPSMDRTAENLEVWGIISLAVKRSGIEAPAEQ